MTPFPAAPRLGTDGLKEAYARVVPTTSVKVRIF
jgi:hypothetical protein